MKTLILLISLGLLLSLTSGKSLSRQRRDEDDDSDEEGPGPIGSIDPALEQRLNELDAQAQAQQQIAMEKFLAELAALDAQAALENPTTELPNVIVA